MNTIIETYPNVMHSCFNGHPTLPSGVRVSRKAIRNGKGDRTRRRKLKS